jgi:hypothetical protein
MIAPTIASSAYTVDSSPVAKPARMVVAGPVSDASAISRTGLYWVAV